MFVLQEFEIVAGRKGCLGYSFADRCPDLSVFRLMINHFDVVPVGIKNERRVVLTTVLRPQSRRFIALSARAKSGVIERVDSLPAVGFETNHES